MIAGTRTMLATGATSRMKIEVELVVERGVHRPEPPRSDATAEHPNRKPSRRLGGRSQPVLRLRSACNRCYTLPIADRNVSSSRDHDLLACPTADGAAHRIETCI